MNENKSQDKCSDCKFYASKDDTNGECHRHSPQLVVMKTVSGGNNTFTRWPEVRADELCGDFSYSSRE